jgi:hypothetical protein
VTRRNPLPDGFLAELDDMAARLDAAGLGDQAARARLARDQAARDPQSAARVLAELADEVSAKAPRRRVTR